MEKQEMGRGGGDSRDGFCSRSREVGGGRRRRWMKTGGGDRWREWSWEGRLPRVACCKSLASLFSGLLGGKSKATSSCISISPFFGLQYMCHPEVVILVLFPSGCAVQSARSTELFFRVSVISFLSPPIPCGSPSFGPTQLKEEPARSGAREGWWATPLSACPPRCLHAAYLASSCNTGLTPHTSWQTRYFLDLQVEDVLQVVGSFCRSPRQKQK